MQDECTCGGCSADDLLIPQLDPLPVDQSVGLFARKAPVTTCTPDGLMFCHRQDRRCNDCPAGAASRLIIGLSGLAGSGKSTAAAHLVNRHGFARVRFAGPLKAMMYALGLSEREVDGDLKDMPCPYLNRANFPNLLASVDHALAAIDIFEGIDNPVLNGHSYRYARDTFIEVLSWIVARGGSLGRATPRLALQMVGTEWGRDRISPTLWVDLWSDAVSKTPAGQPVAVDDCRFPNEADAIRAAGGFLVRVERPGAGAGAAGHSSEGQDLGTPVATVKNTGSIPWLGKCVDALVRDLSWIESPALSPRLGDEADALGTV